MSANSLFSHKVHLDFLRIFAIFLVLFNHTHAFSYPFSHDSTTFFGGLSLVFSICAKIAVPIFFMISGALLLDKSESINKVLQHRVLRFIIIIILFQFLQHGFAYYFHGITTNAKTFLTHLIKGQECGIDNWVVWYLYAYLAFLISLPILRILAKSMSNLHYIYLFAIQILTCAFIPCIETRYTDYLFLCSVICLYPLAGYFTEHRVDITLFSVKYKKNLITASIICIIMGILMCQTARIIDGDKFVSQNVLCVKGCLLIPCITLFLIAKGAGIFLNNSRWRIVFMSMGSAVFFIALTENILRYFSSICIHIFFPSSYLSDIFTIILACLIGFPVGMALKRISWINKLI